MNFTIFECEPRKGTSVETSFFWENALKSSLTNAHCFMCHFYLAPKFISGSHELLLNKLYIYTRRKDLELHVYRVFFVSYVFAAVNRRFFDFAPIRLVI